MTIPETIDAILANLEKGLVIPAEARQLIIALGADEALADEMIAICQGETDLKNRDEDEQRENNQNRRDYS